MMRAYPLLLLLMLLLLPATGCSTAPAAGWSVVANAGPTRAAPPADDFTSAMEASGFDATSPAVEAGVVFPGSEHPLRDDEGSLWRVEVRRAFAGGFGAGLVAGHAELGSVVGYAEPDPDVLGAHLMLSYDVLVASPVATFSHPLHDRVDLHLLAGPAAFRTGIQDDGPRADDRSEDWRLGALAGAGFSLRLFRGLFLEGRAGYRRVGEASAGPYTVTNFEGNEAVFPATGIRFDHGYWGLGLGWSF